MQLNAATRREDVALLKRGSAKKKRSDIIARFRSFLFVRDAHLAVNERNHRSSSKGQMLPFFVWI